MAKGGWVYILTNKFRGVLYIGVTSDLSNRLNQHHVATDSFPARYKLKRLVYAEEYPTIQEAILREKQLKNWHRNWKINLIEKSNATWQDLLDPETSSG